MQQLRRISRLPAVPQWSIAAVACLFTVYARVYDLLRVTTFRVRHSRGEVYIGHGRLRVCVSVCLYVPRRIPTLLHAPECNLGKW